MWACIKFAGQDQYAARDLNIILEIDHIIIPFLKKTITISKTTLCSGRYTKTFINLTKYTHIH